MFPVHSSECIRLRSNPDMHLKARCLRCKHIAFRPMRFIKASAGDLSFREMLTKLRCGRSKAIPAPVFLLAGQHREFCWGSRPDWAIELVPAAI